MVRLVGPHLRNERRNLGWRPARSEAEAKFRLAAVSFCAGQRDAPRPVYGYSTFPYRLCETPAMSKKELDNFIRSGSTLTLSPHLRETTDNMGSDAPPTEGARSHSQRRRDANRVRSEFYKFWDAEEPILAREIASSAGCNYLNSGAVGSCVFFKMFDF